MRTQNTYTHIGKHKINNKEYLFYVKINKKNCCLMDSVGHESKIHTILELHFLQDFLGIN